MNKPVRLLAAAVIPFLICALLFGCKKEPDPPEPTTEFTFNYWTTTTEEDTTEEETTEEETTEEETTTTTTTRRTTTTTRRTTTTKKPTTKTTTTKTTTKPTTTTNKYTTVPDGTKVTTTKGPTTTAPTTTKAPTTTVPPTTVKVTGVAFTGGVTSYTLKAGATHNLGNSYAISPSSATNKKVRWFSVPNNIASVSSTGLVTALKDGECKIYIETEDGSFQDSVTIKVEVVPVETINISSPGGVDNLAQGKTLQLNATALPTTATNKAITWTSSDSSIATVSSTGLVSAVNKNDNVARYVRITATAADGKGATRYVDLTITVP